VCCSAAMRIANKRVARLKAVCHRELMQRIMSEGGESVHLKWRKMKRKNRKDPKWRQTNVDRDEV